jgi:repressor LexA
MGGCPLRETSYPSSLLATEVAEESAGEGFHPRRFPLARQSQTREKILRFISGFKDSHGYAPTVREIAAACGVASTSVVQYHLVNLEKAGVIAKEKDRFRSIRLSEESRDRAAVPLLGAIAAGHPIWVPSVDRWSAEAERSVDVPPAMIQGKGGVYALEVRGNSMVDAMIADSDIVIMEQVAEVRNGEVAACWLKMEQEVTLKKVYYENGRIRLQPCNPYMMPFYHDAENVEIQGRVIGVIRTLR